MDGRIAAFIVATDVAAPSRRVGELTQGWKPGSYAPVTLHYVPTLQPTFHNQPRVNITSVFIRIDF